MFFQPHALALWVCFGQLQDLEIYECDDLVYWPEKVFQSLISLRRLEIYSCKNLIGYAAAVANGPDQEAMSQLLLPHLESLEILGCESLVEVFNFPSSLRVIDIWGCSKLRFMSGQLDALNNLGPVPIPRDKL